MIIFFPVFPVEIIKCRAFAKDMTICLRLELVVIINDIHKINLNIKQIILYRTTFFLVSGNLEYTKSKSKV